MLQRPFPMEGAGLEHGEVFGCHLKLLVEDGRARHHLQTSETQPVLHGVLHRPAVGVVHLSEQVIDERCAQLRGADMERVVQLGLDAAVACLEHLVHLPRVHQGDVLVEHHEVGGHLSLVGRHLLKDIVEAEFIQGAVHPQLVTEVLVEGGLDGMTEAVVVMPNG